MRRQILRFKMDDLKSNGDACTPHDDDDDDDDDPLLLE